MSKHSPYGESAHRLCASSAGPTLQSCHASVLEFLPRHTQCSGVTTLSQPPQCRQPRVCVPQSPTSARGRALTQQLQASGVWAGVSAFHHPQLSPDRGASSSLTRRVQMRFRDRFAEDDLYPALGPLPTPPPPPALLTLPEHVEQLVQHISSVSTRAPEDHPWPPLIALHSHPVELGSLPSGKRGVLLVLAWREGQGRQHLTLHQGTTGACETSPLIHFTPCPTPAMDDVAVTKHKSSWFLIVSRSW
jgi:hypothetical protein